jgi:hypothetical protein
MWVVIGVVKESWNAELHPVKHQSDCIQCKKIFRNSCGNGEPLMWDMTLLTQTLKENGRKVHIETSELIR